MTDTTANPPSPRILALDMGTSSVRAMVLDGACRPLPEALARRKVTIAVDDEGAATLDPGAYLAGLVDCLDELASAGRLVGVGLVAASGQWHSALPVAADGAPLGPVLTWLDSRAAQAAAAAERSAAPAGPADPAAFHARTGTWWHGLYWSVRLPWLRARLGGPVGRFVGLPEYVFGRLLDEAPMSVSQASGTGLLDLAKLDWDAEACALAGVGPGELPALAPPGWRGRLRAEFARRWPQLAGAAWTAPVGDGAASNVGSGAADPGRVAITVGTSAAVRLVQPAGPGVALPPLPDRLWRYRVDHDRIVTGAAYSNGGNVYAWAQRVLRLPEDPVELEAELARAPADEGLSADPRLGGDRPPGTAPAGSGELRGISFATTAVDLLAALLRGVCRRIVDDVVVLESTVDGPVAVRLGGGAVAASPWLQREFLVALSPRSVQDVAQPEVGATGAAMIATGQAGDAGPVAG
jgi:gluconokinase